MMEEHFTPLAEQDCTSSNQALVILPWTRFTSIKKYNIMQLLVVLEFFQIFICSLINTIFSCRL